MRHDQIRSNDFATKIAVLKDGVLQAGTPAEIYNRPDNIFVADFMGSPAMNLIPAKVVGGGKAVKLEIGAHGGKPLVLNVGSHLNSYSGKAVVFGILPEAITDPEGADRTSRNLITADCSSKLWSPRVPIFCVINPAVRKRLPVCEPMRVVPGTMSASSI
jgi:multiple sugar transport system ATP-binding protein